MSELIEEAIKKIDEEAEKNNSDMLYTVSAQYIIDNIKSDEIADKILASEKSLERCIDAITNKARKKATNNRACFSEQEVYTLIREYWGLENTAPASKKPTVLDFDPLANL